MSIHVKFKFLLMSKDMNLIMRKAALGQQSK
jgi:hypothetical protein